MKNLFFSLLITVIGAFVIGACSSSQGISKKSDSPKATKLVGEGQLINNLADLLRKNTPLQIQGTHPNVAISVRGINTIEGDSRPFFIVDGVRLGRSYTQANNAINFNNVKRIRIFKSLSELAVFGEDGVNGVISIEHAN